MRTIKFRAWDKNRRKMFIPKKLCWWILGLCVDSRLATVEGNANAEYSRGERHEQIILMQ